MKTIGIRTMDRSGSNLFLYLFHCHPEFFSLYEKLDLKHFDLNEIPWGCSMFRGKDKKIKITDKEQIKYIVIKNTRKTFENENVLEYEYNDYDYDKKIYLIRNPFRVYLSFLKRWKRSELWFESVIRITKNNIEAYKENLENNLDVRLISYEYFLNNFNEEYNNILKWTAATKTTVSNQMRFNGISGQGGFQSKEKISYERSVREDIKFLKDKVPIARTILGDELIDYWFNDREHNYKRLLKI